jgi:hypothetical protein
VVGGIVSTDTLSPAVRAAAVAAVASCLALWLVIVVRQVADGGFYSDDWALQWEWHHYGFFEAVTRQFDFLGSKPLLGILLIGSYEVLGTDPARHQLVVALLTLACMVGFFLVLRELRFPLEDAVPITLLALLFPWASSVRFWATGGLNNFAVLLFFAGLLTAFWGLRVEGKRGLLIHVGATACYVASILTYEVTTGVALFAWTTYVWLGGWRAALPRMALDVPAVVAVAIYTAETTIKPIYGLADQLGQVPDMVLDGADLIAATLLPVAIPAEIPAALTAALLTAALAVLVLAAVRDRPRPGGSPKADGFRWAVIALCALAALALCWAVFVPQVFYTPTFRGIEDRVNILALYPAAVLVWSVLRAAGSLLPRHGYSVTAVGAACVAIGFGVQDLRQQNHWLRSAELQPKVLAAVEHAHPHDGAVVLVFDYPAETARGVPVFDTNYDLKPAARLMTGSDIDTYPVFTGSTVRCSPKGIAIDYLATPLYWRISTTEEGTAKLQPYGNVMFVDVGGARHELIRSREQCTRALGDYRPGLWEGSG